MGTKKILSCKGFHICNVMIPSFEVCEGDHLGIAYPADYGIQWNELMESLGVLHAASEVHIAVRSAVISPPGFHPLEQTLGAQTITDVAEARGLSRHAVERIAISLGLDPASPYRDLQLTSRLLFDLSLAWAQGAELVVFSTAGLDPSGIVAVAAEVSNMLEQSAAIHIFSAELIHHYESLISFAKVIRCNLVA